jgi:hypothetical protein
MGYRQISRNKGEMKMRFQCEECFDDEYIDIIGSGEDEKGEFTDYECAECHHINRIHDNKENKN